MIKKFFESLVPQRCSRGELSAVIGWQILTADSMHFIGGEYTNETNKYTIVSKYYYIYLELGLTAHLW
jgi:hypothetical protein